MHYSTDNPLQCLAYYVRIRFYLFKVEIYFVELCMSRAEIEADDELLDENKLLFTFQTSLIN